MRYDDGQTLLKSAVRLSIPTNTSYKHYMEIPIDEFIEVASEVNRIGREQKSARAYSQNRR